MVTLKSKTHGYRLGAAWLVTWEGTSSPKPQNERIVSILNYRRSSDQVLKYVEQLYVDRLGSLQEKVTIARHRTNNPHHAEYVRVNGVQWQGEITCGHNPHLSARPVKNLVLHEGADGEEVLTWDEIPVPKCSL